MTETTLRGRWAAETRAAPQGSSEGVLFPASASMAKVKILFEPFRQHFGEYLVMDAEKAAAGQGKFWHVVEIFEVERRW